MDFIGKLGKYKIIETEDQTKTLWSEFFNENCHNLSGAYEETFYNYIQGCHIPDQILNEKEIHVLDVGFGLGIGLRAYIDEIKKHANIKNKIFTYTSMELDEDLFLWSIKENFPQLIFEKKTYYYISEYQLNEITLTIKVFIGDGRLTLPRASKENLIPKFSAIFQDAFSPKKNPTLWTCEWFNDLKMMSLNEVYLSTYSSSVSIRKSMIAAGWIIANQKGFGQKRTMTKARLIGEIDPSLAAELSRSPTLELKDT
jgi:tRNA U34 5-methylaminomethyl-2-thiouridine-forming methyltransferase MnmC